MRKLDFYGLPRSLQDRFIESSRGAAVPTPLAVQRVTNARPLKWGLGTVLGLVGWVGFTSLGFGDLKSSWALGSTFHLGIHIALAFLVVFCALRSYASSWESTRAFFGEGTYLFPSGVIQVLGGTLSEFDAKDLGSVLVDGSLVTLVGTGGRRFAFQLNDGQRADEVRAAYESGRDRWISLGEDESLERARLHSLVESGVPNPLAPTQAHRRPVLFSHFSLVALTALVAVGLGFGVSSLRNSFSEKELYRAAVQTNTAESYQAYLARGGARPDVADLFLPRAELERAMRVGTVSAIEAFIAKNPKTKIGAEVQAVHRAALLAELAKAQSVGTLAAIEEVRQSYPAHKLIELELAAARKSAFTQALQVFQAQAAEKNQALVPFVQALLDYTEVHGPTVRVRVAHQFPQSKEMLDSIVSKSEEYYLGRKSLPTQYFLGEPKSKRETALAEALIARLAQAFPADVVRFEFVGPSLGENQELPPVDKPTLTLTHKESLSGAFVGGKPKSVYLGATVVITALLELPGEETTLKYVYSTWRAPNFQVLVEKDIPDVYEDMMSGAFGNFQKAYLETWFREP